MSQHLRSSFGRLRPSTKNKYMLPSPVCDLLGIEFPIIQAGMGPFTSAELVAAVSNAGALGSLGAGARTTESYKDVIFFDASKKLHAQGKEAFIQAYTPFLRSVEKVQVKQLILEEPKACAVVSYDYVSPMGNRLHQDDAEVWKVVNGKIVALTIYSDITEYRTFMAR